MIAKPKLRTYATFKGRYELEEYIERIRCKAQWSVVARLRRGIAPLEIETARYVGIPAEQRIYKSCRGAIEDEVHFCITCPALVLPPHPMLLQAMDSITPGFKGLCDRQKLIKVIHAANKDHKVMNSLFNLFMA